MSRYGLPSVRDAATPTAPGICADDALDLERLLLQRVEIVAEDLDADLRADAGADHQDAVFNRLQKAGHVAGHLRQFFFQLGDEFFLGHARTPLRFRLEHDGRLDHFDGRGIGGGFGAAEFAADTRHFGRLTDDLVLPGHDAFHFRERRARQQHRHEQQTAFVQRRHEFAAHAAREFRCELRMTG